MTLRKKKVMEISLAAHYSNFETVRSFKHVPHHTLFTTPMAACCLLYGLSEH